jgi:DNA-binding NtrC family response regulator
MRAIEVNPRLPVLVVARFLDMDSYREAIQLGAIDYLIEPLTVWEIGRLLETHSRVERQRNGSGTASGRTGWEGRSSGKTNAAEAVLEPVAAAPGMR